MYCEYCGKENKDGDIFCYNCGKKLNENVIMQQSLKQEKKNFLPWIFTGNMFNDCFGGICFMRIYVCL